MEQQPSRWPLIAFTALVIALLAALSLCAMWEPIAFDSWGHWIARRRRDFDAGELWLVVRQNYLAGNPRIGQTFTVWMYASDVLHAIATPLLCLSMLLTLAALALGRWPSPRRGDDVALFAIVAAMVVIAAPAPAAAVIFSYRPYTGNYVLGLLLHLLLFLPYRFHAVLPRPRHLMLAPLLFVLGIAAGFGNEHTGPASIALLVAALVYFRRRGDRWSAWMFAGLVGLAIGYLLLFFAPGQNERYSGLMADTSIADLLFGRGLTHVRTLGVFLLCAAALLPWLIAARLRPGERVRGLDRWTIAALLAAGALMTLALLASPKQGWRLYFAPLCLWIAASAMWIRLRVKSRDLVRLAAVSVVLLAVHLAVLLHVQHRVHAASEVREDRLAAAPPGSQVVVPRFAYGKSPWCIGDDLLEPKRRQVLAQRLGLRAIELEP